MKTEWKFGPASVSSAVSDQSPETFHGSVINSKFQKAISEENELFLHTESTW